MINTLKAILRVTGLFHIARDIYHRSLQKRHLSEVKRQRKWLSQFDNPWPDAKPRTIEEYRSAIKDADQATERSSFPSQVKQVLDVEVPEDFIYEIGRLTKATFNNVTSKPSYDQGHVLYGAVKNYCANNLAVKQPMVLEVGTCVGFSSLVMAKALEDSNVPGKVLTIDVIPTDIPIYKNTISDLAGKNTLKSAFADYGQLLEDKLICVRGSSDIVLKNINLPRVHVAFLDGNHTAHFIATELERISNFQQAGDFLIVDDYTETCPDVVTETDKFLEKGEYSPVHLFERNETNGVVLGMYLLQRL